MIKHRIVLILIVLLLVSYLSLTNFRNNIFYAHQQALAVKDDAMRYFPASILAYSSNNTLVGSDKETKFFVYENPFYGWDDYHRKDNNILLSEADFNKVLLDLE